MADIRIDYDGLSQNRADIGQRISELQKLNGSLDALLSQIEGGWEGKTSRRYIEKMREQKRKAEKMVEVFTEFRRYMENVVTEFQTEDSTDATRIRGC